MLIVQYKLVPDLVVTCTILTEPNRTKSQSLYSELTGIYVFMDVSLSTVMPSAEI